MAQLTESNDRKATAFQRYPFQRAWIERSWAAALLFAGLLVGTWAIVLASEVGDPAGSIHWLHLATKAILLGLLPVVAVLVLAFAWRHRSVSEALEAAEARITDMAAASSDWLWEMGPELKFTLVSDRIPGMTEAEIAALAGRTWQEAVNTSFDEKAWACLAEDLAARRPFRDMVYLEKAADGDLRWRKISGRPFFDAKGRFQGYRGTGTDITEQKQAEMMLRKAHRDRQSSEDRFRALVANIPGAVYQTDCDADFTIRFVSDGIRELCGVPASDFSSASRRRFLRFVHPDDRAMVEQATRTAIAERTPYAIEYRVLHADGSIRWVCDKGRAAYDADGKPLWLDGAIFDATDLKRAESALIEAKNAAENTSRAKTEFLAEMSHELRTPLNAIIGFSDLVRSEVYGPIGNDLYKEYLQDIMTSGNHLLGLINDILDLSKAEAGMMTLHDEPADAADIARECLGMLRQQAEAAHIELGSRIAEDLPALVCDERKVKQMLLNLLSNGIKFTPEGGRVMLEAAVVAAGLQMTVRDTGVGIAKADIATALSAFGRVDSELSRNRQGTGLGLPLTKHLAEAHGASFEIDSTLGVGTTVTITFPHSRLVKKAA